MAANACQGRGSATSYALFVLLICALWSGAAAATTWKVGDNSNWTTNVDYSTWTAGKTFAVGDTLFFAYAKGAHDVAQVDETNYNACTSTNTIVTYTGGNSNVTLNSTGTDYFICTITGHCAAKMKLSVKVVSAASPSGSSTNGTNSTSGSSGPLTAISPHIGYFAAISAALIAGLSL